MLPKKEEHVAVLLHLRGQGFDLYLPGLLYFKYQQSLLAAY